MIVMVGAAVADTRTTILIVPLIALRNDLLGRFHKVGFQLLF
jgi:hypothetical protein